VTTIGPPDHDPDEVVAHHRTEDPPAGDPPTVSLRPVRPPEWWCELVARCTADLRDPAVDLSKVVLAREVLAEADGPFDRAAILRRLHERYPGCFVFHVDGFLGASPELLVRRQGPLVRAQPMAGTAPRGGDPESDAELAAALLASPTYRHEHQITIDMVYDTLLPWCSYLDYEAEPSIVAIANVQHLATFVEGRLSDPPPSVLDLVAALHPTPAVSGWPRDAAVAWIEANEGFDRGRYAGAVGWVDGTGNGAWAVSIRCAEVHGAQARLFAGNGIVSDSEPRAELAETEAKLAAVVAALRG
jgi:menaquinone-specific isochorismate synthase